MKNKKIILLVIIILLTALAFFCLRGNKNKSQQDEQTSVNTVTEKTVPKETKPEIKDDNKEDISINTNTSKEDVKQAKIEMNNKLDNKKKTVKLYEAPSGAVLPLSGLSLISDLPSNIQDKISKIAESNNIYMVQKNKDKVFIVTDNPENIRHSVEFTEISLLNGHQVKTTLGYNDKMKDSENDIWEYDKDTKQPTRHTKYNSTGDMEFVEVWNYDNDNPVKYEMKDADGHVLSMRKETLDNGVNLRVEHLVYDKDGKTRINVSATYDGADVKRFTYYNADKPGESGSVHDEYFDGLKTKEIVYTSDLKVKNSYTAKYKDGDCEEITVWDNQNKEVTKLSPKETVDRL